IFWTLPNFLHAVPTSSRVRDPTKTTGRFSFPSVSGFSYFLALKAKTAVRLGSFRLESHVKNERAAALRAWAAAGPSREAILAPAVIAGPRNANSPVGNGRGPSSVPFGGAGQI